jgi:hypothetical protein
MKNGSILMKDTHFNMVQPECMQLETNLKIGSRITN